MKVVAHIHHVPYSAGYMFAEAEPAYDELCWGAPRYNGDRALVTLEDAEAAIAEAVKTALEGIK